MSKLKLSSNASGSGNVTLQSPNTNSDFIVTVPTGTGALPLMKLETAVASTSGTSIDFTSIPSWVKRITVMFSGVSTNGTSNLLIQIGSGSVTTSGYTSQAQQAANAASSSAGLIVTQSITAASNILGFNTINLVGGTTYVASGIITSGGAVFSSAGGSPSLSGALDRVRITTVNGTDTFDAGSINIMYEG